MTEQWLKISQNLQKTLDAGCYKVWIMPLHASMTGDRLILTAPSAYVAEKVDARFAEAIRAAARPVLGSDFVLEICAGKASPAPTRTMPSISVAAPRLCPEQQEAPAPQPVAAQPALAQPVQPPLVRATQQGMLPFSTAGAPLVRPQARQWRYSFDDLVTGPSNEMAVAGARDLSRHGSVETLFVSAPSGLGKTHLAQAVGRVISSNADMGRVGYLTADEFASRFVAAMRQNDLETFKAQVRALDVLLLEDVHFLQGKEKMQEQVLGLSKSLQERGSRVVMTSSFSPREMQHVDSQLLSHFSSGLLTSISKPTADMRRAILERKASVHQVLLPSPVSELLAERLSDDVRQLESCLNSLVFKAKLLNRSISLEMAWDVLGEYAQASGLDFGTIVRLVCESFGLTEHQLSSRSRRADYVLGRNTIYYLARKHTELSLQQIGDKFNRRHSTVIKGITSIERELSAESRVGRQVASTVTLIERNAGVSL
jgi:chromosomal replication initiator protein